MFENSSLFIIEKKEEEFKIFRLKLSKKIQNSINLMLSSCINKNYNNKYEIEFDGSYKPDESELLYITGFSLEEKIKEAVREPLGVKELNDINYNFENINTIFIGEYNNGEYTIGFQKFKKEQFISNNKINLFFDKTTFIKEERNGISIAENFDCVYTNNCLKFTSFFYARQIFNLSEYYRIATDNDVDKLTNDETLLFENKTKFKDSINDWTRRRIASILDSKVLKDYKAKEIKKIGQNVGISIKIEKDKIVIPSNKKELKDLFSFLDESIYKGYFTNNIYSTNSKHKVLENKK